MKEKKEMSPREETLELLRTIAQWSEANNTLLTALVEGSRLTGNALARFAEEVIERSAAPAASQTTDQTPAASEESFKDFTAETMVCTIEENGEKYFKIRGFPYLQYGVRIWPEVLEAMGIHPENIKPGKTDFKTTVRAVLNGKDQPKKIIGLAPDAPPPILHDDPF